MSSSSRKRRLVSPQQPDEEQAEPRAARRTDRIVVDVGGIKGGANRTAQKLIGIIKELSRVLSSER